MCIALAGCAALPFGHEKKPAPMISTVGVPDAPVASEPPPPAPEERVEEQQPLEEDESPDEVLPPAASGLATASRYAGLDRDTCEAELKHRKIPFTRVETARGVVAPLRLDGPLSGVTFRSNLPAAKARTSVFDIYDCRLVLALDDFARVLSKHGVTEVVHLSVYRPVSSKTVLNGPGRRHTGALAIDAALFKTSDGKTLSVEKDFHGRIGAKPCPAPESATELRKIACEAHDAGLFNVLLTPDYNWPHRNHFHLEVTAGVKWTLVR